MGYLDDVAAAQASLDDAERRYETAVQEAEKQEEQAREEYARRIKDANQALERESEQWHTPLGTFGNLKLFADHMECGGESISIMDGVDVRVDVSDAQEENRLCLTIASNDGQIVEEAKLEDESAARDFAESVINQSKGAREALERHARVLAQANQAVREAVGDTSEIDAAAAAVQAARSNTHERDEAARLLEQVRASGAEKEAVTRMEGMQPATRAKTIGIGAAAAIALLAMLFATHVICFHKWQDPTCENPQTCSVCGRTKGDPLGHEWKKATCTEPKTCTRCGKEEGEALGHEVEDWKTVKKATCTEKGKREGVCVRCGETRSRSTKLKDHAFSDWTTVKEASCTEEGLSERTCKNCGKKESETLAKKDHTPGDWQVIRNATVTSNGSVNPGMRARLCTACGAQLETEEFTLELTMGQRNALAKAASYLSWTNFSHQGLVQQLEFEGFSSEDAVFAADNCGADWNEQAVGKAESYLSWTSFSRDGLISQLEFEGFTYDQAAYAATQVGY